MGGAALIAAVVCVCGGRGVQAGKSSTGAVLSAVHVW